MTMLRFTRGIGKALIYTFLILVAAVTLFPVIYVFFASFKNDLQIMTDGINILPKQWNFDNYIQAWNLANFGKFTFNSLYMAFFIVTGAILFSSMSGYVFSRGNFVGKKIIFAAFIGTMFVSLGSATLYAVLQVAKFYHINRGLIGVIIISVLGLHISSVYLIRGFLNSLSKEIDEAAKIDGCSFFRIYWNIMLPISKPILATIAILSFKGAWNEYLMPLIFTLSDPDQQPLIVGVINLRNTGEGASSWRLMLAGTMISVIPMITIYLIMNKQFVESVASGAVKG